jgi:hypothetical protein
MLFNPRIVEEAYVQAKYLENTGDKKGKPSCSKWKEHQYASKEGKKKWKGKDKNMTPTAHQCKDPSNHSNHYNIDDHMKENTCWKLHPNLNPKDCKCRNLMTKSACTILCHTLRNLEIIVMNEL